MRQVVGLLVSAKVAAGLPAESLTGAWLLLLTFYRALRPRTIDGKYRSATGIGIVVAIVSIPPQRPQGACVPLVERRSYQRHRHMFPLFPGLYSH